MTTFKLTHLIIFPGNIIFFWYNIQNIFKKAKKEKINQITFYILASVFHLVIGKLRTKEYSAMQLQINYLGEVFSKKKSIILFKTQKTPDKKTLSTKHMQTSEISEIKDIYWMYWKNLIHLRFMSSWQVLSRWVCCEDRVM